MDKKKVEDNGRVLERRSRRQFLKHGSALVGAASFASAAELGKARADVDNGPPNIPMWMKAPGADVGSQPYGAPSRFEKKVIRNLLDYPQYTSAASRTPLQDLDGIITPNGLFYERHHSGIPDIDPAQHRLMIHGLVERPLLLTVEEVRRFPSQSRVHFIECSGNPDFDGIYRKTPSDLVGLVSCAEWTGASLRDVLDRKSTRLNSSH